MVRFMHLLGLRAVGATAVTLFFMPLVFGAVGPAPDPKTLTVDLAITDLQASPIPYVVAGSSITYTVFFINHGPDAANNAYVKLPTPPFTRFVSASAGTSAGWVVESAPAAGSTGDVVFANTTGVAAGEPQACFEVVVQVDPAVLHYTTIVANAVTYDIGGDTIDPSPANDAMSLARNAVTVVDPAEPNESPATAHVLPIGTSSGFLYSIGDTIDSDWYKFTVPLADTGKDLKVNVRVTSVYPDPIPAGWGSDLDFSILDGTVALKAIAVSSNDDETLYLHNVAAGDYYIYIDYSSTAYAEGNRFARYAISIETGTEFGIGLVYGRVVLDGGGGGVAHAIVQAPVYPASTDNWHVSFASVTTDAEGYFTIATAPGDHYFGFTGSGDISVNNPEVNIVDEFYLDKPTKEGAGYVTSGPGSISNLGDIHVAEGAILSGQVTDMGGAPLGNVAVSSYASQPTTAASITYTDASGNYTLKRVPSPAAKVRFSKANYGLEWYNDLPAFAPATTLATTPGAIMGGINAQLAVAGQVSGTVKDLAGNGLAVTLSLYSSTDLSYPRATLVSTPGTGAFTFRNLKAGTYKLFVNPIGTGLGAQWYEGASGPSSASAISVAAGVTTAGINVILAPPASQGDFTGDLKSDVLWRHATNGDLWAWGMDGASSHFDYYVSSVADADWEIRAVADFTGDRLPDLLWRNKSDGQVYLWSMGGTAPAAQTYVATVDLAYDIESYGDYDADGKADLLWRHAVTGELWAWIMDGPAIDAAVYVATVDPAYKIEASADFNGDGLCDVLWRGTTAGDVWIWLVQDDAPQIEAYVGVVPDLGYRIEAAADFGGDGRADILWRHATQGDLWIWMMNGAAKTADAYVGTVSDTTYEIASTGDYNGDFMADILWWNSVNGEVWAWFMNGATKASEALVGVVPDTGYRVVR